MGKLTDMFREELNKKPRKIYKKSTHGCQVKDKQNGEDSVENLLYHYAAGLWYDMDYTLSQYLDPSGITPENYDKLIKEMEELVSEAKAYKDLMMNKEE